VHNPQSLPRRLMSDYQVNLINDSMSEFYVKFHGPKDSERELPLWSPVVSTH
jgi:hypothetical protein